jgi:hypothetical protein
MVDCGCGGKKIKKNLLGGLVSAIGGIAKGFGAANAMGQGAGLGTTMLNYGAKATALGGNINKVNNVAKVAAPIYNTMKGVLNANKSSTPGIVPQTYASISPNVNPQVPNNAVTETNPIPMGMQRTVPSFTPVVEKGGKLKKKILKKG